MAIPTCNAIGFDNYFKKKIVPWILSIDCYHMENHHTRSVAFVKKILLGRPNNNTYVIIDNHCNLLLESRNLSGEKIYP